MKKITGMNILYLLFFIYISGNNNMVKRERVYGGCLGVSRRRRPWQAAKSCGEEHTSIDPQIAEWGNPTVAILLSIIEHIGNGGETRGTEPSKYPGNRKQT